MRSLLSIGDLHIKIHADVPLEWQRARYHQLFDWVEEYCITNDAGLVLAGDQLDTIHPKKEETQLLREFLLQLDKSRITTYMVSGNHETISAGESILDYMVLQQYKSLVYRPGTPLHISGDVVLHLLNHDSLKTPPRPVPGRLNILVSHFRPDYNKWVREEVDVLSLVDGFDLVIAGDIHDHFSFNQVHYTNNPINKEFEANPHCGCIVVHLDMNSVGILQPRVEKIPLQFPALRALTCTAEQWPIEIPEGDYCKVTVSGSQEALRTLAPADVPVTLNRVPEALQVTALPGEDSAQVDQPLLEGLPDYLLSLDDLDEGGVEEMMTFLHEELLVA